MWNRKKSAPLYWIDIGGAIIAVSVLILLTMSPNPWALPAFIVATITLGIVVIRAVLDFRKEKFKKRIAQHITEGIVLRRNMASYVSSVEYDKIANDWVNKVVSDIRKHRGQSEADQFLAEYPKKQKVSMESEDTQRDRIQNILSSRIDWLEWLQMRL